MLRLGVSRCLRFQGLVARSPSVGWSEIQNRRMFCEGFKNMPKTIQNFNEVIKKAIKDSDDASVINTCLTQMNQQGIRPDINTYNLIIQFHCNSLNLEEAEKVLENLPRKGLRADTNSYNPIIAYLCRIDRETKALEKIEELKKNGLQPNVTTYNALLLQHCISLDMKGARNILNEMKTKGIAPDYETHRAVTTCVTDIDDVYDLFIQATKLAEKQ